MLAKIETGQVEVLDDAALPAIFAAFGRREELERGGLARRDGAKELVVLRSGGGEVFPGYDWREVRSGRHERRTNGVLCHTAIEIQSAVGCPFDCTYCPYTTFVCARLDVEALVEQVTRLASTRRTQTLFKLNNRTDTLGLEPEYSLAPALIERFAALPGKYLMLYTKGDRVDHLLDLDHRGKTIASFTLTPAPVAALLEPGAPPPAARIEAIGRLAAAGYPIRVRLSPIVPVRDWRAAYQALIARLLEVAHPEMVTLWTLSMIELPELFRIVPESVLDPVALAVCRAAVEQMRGQKGAPLPPVLRAEIYRTIARELRTSAPATLVSLCLESPEVWDAVSPLVVPRHRGRFVCNCGPRATPEVASRIRARHHGHRGPSG